MFFGIIASVSPTIKRIVRSSIGPCPNPNCSTTNTVDEVELANKLSLFFVPVWNFNAKEVVYCSNCRFMSSPEEYENWLVSRAVEQSKSASAETGRGSATATGINSSGIDSSAKKTCGGCGAAMEDGWGFCPNCGAKAF